MLFRKRITPKKIDRCEITQKQYKCCNNKSEKRKKKRSLKPCILLFPPINRRISPGKVSLYISRRWIRKASMTVEAALVLPLFFLGMVTMISYMDVYRIQTEHLVKLCEKAKEAGMYAYNPRGEGKAEILLPDVYAYQPAAALLPLPKVWMHNRVRVHAWTGAEETESPNPAKAEPMVYVTENGSVYHRSPGCSYLNLSVNQVSGSAVGTYRNQHGERYTACEICSRNQGPAGSVFITGQGNRYHNMENCSALKRGVMMVKESDCGHMGPCSRCG